MKLIGTCLARDLSTSIRIPVVAIGYQEWPEGPPRLLVNDPSGSTQVYDPDKYVVTAAVNGLELGEVNNG